MSGIDGKSMLEPTERSMRYSKTKSGLANRLQLIDVSSSKVLSTAAEKVNALAVCKEIASPVWCSHRGRPQKRIASSRQNLY
jgi:hypothetical protein